MNLNTWSWSGDGTKIRSNTRSCWTVSYTDNDVTHLQNDDIVEVVKHFDLSSEDDQIEAVYRNVYSILAIHEPSQELQAYIMDYFPKHFKLIRNPSLETCERAIEIDHNNGYFINFKNYPKELYQKWKLCLYS